MKYSETKVSCPLCWNHATYLHTWKTKPVFGACEKCGFEAVLGYSSRGMIEHRRPKFLHDFEWYENYTPHEGSDGV